MSGKINIAVVGATGAVGEAMFAILAESSLPIGQVAALASSRSAGKPIQFRDQQLIVQDLAEFDFSKVQVALFSAGGETSAKFVPIAAAAGAVCIDNTAYFRQDPTVPLVIPEVNPHAIAHYSVRNIIANPNCSTIQMLVALKPLYDAVGIKRITVSTYQSVSGKGKRGVDELREQSRALLENQEFQPNIFSTQIAFNVIPHIDSFQENRYTREEMKMVWETQKIFENTEIQVNPTTVRVPVFCGHSEAIHIETFEKISVAHALELLQKAPGVIVQDECADRGYPTPAMSAAGRDGVYVGRVRQDLFSEYGLNLWVVSDNTRKGAALNAIQIAERLVREYF